MRDHALDTATFSVPQPVTLAGVRADGSRLYASGQIATEHGQLIATGLLGETVDIETGQRCAWQCARNVLTAVRDALGSLDRIEHVIRLGIYVASAPGFTSQPLVAHGASHLIHDVLGPEAGAHARTAIGVASLPLGTPVEVDAIFRIRP